MRNSPPPPDHLRTLGIVTHQGERYRGTSLIRNSPPPFKTAIGPWV